VTLAAGRRPGPGLEYTMTVTSNCMTSTKDSPTLFESHMPPDINDTTSASHLEGCLMVYTTPKVVYTTLGIYHGIYQRERWYISWYIP